MWHDLEIHVLGATAFEILKALVVGVLLIQLQKLGVSRSKPLIFQAVGGVLLIILLLFAIHAYQGSGFADGIRFSIDCFLSLLLAGAVIYSSIRKFLPIGSKRLDWLDHARWQLESSPGGKAQIALSRRKMLSLVARFEKEENRWSQMSIVFDGAESFRGWAGIRVRVEPDEMYPDSSINLQVRISNGAIYRSQFFPLEKRDFIFLFQDMVLAGWSEPNPLQYLELRNVERVIIGMNTPYDKISARLGHFCLVDYSSSRVGSVASPV